MIKNESAAKTEICSLAIPPNLWTGKRNKLEEKQGMSTRKLIN